VDNNENSLFSGWALLLFSLVIILILFVLFPGKKLLTSFSNNPTDRTTIEYLKTLIDKEPENATLKINLANAQISIGHLSKAEQTLSQLLADEKYNNEAQFLIIKIQFSQYFELSQPRLKNKKKVQLLTHITQLYPQESNIKKLNTLAEWSQQLAEPILASRIYEHIIKILEHQSPDQANNKQMIWLLLGINSAHAEQNSQDIAYYALKHLQALLAANQTEQALSKAKLYVSKFNDSKAILELSIKIAGYANDSVQSRDFGRLMLTQFGWSDQQLEQQIIRELAANDSKNSFQWAKSELKHHSASARLLAYTAKLASNLGNIEFSKKLTLKLLSQSPNEPELIKKIIYYSLGSKDLESALKYAQHLVELEPNNIAAHTQLANIALWAENPTLSMQQHHWLYQQTRNESFSNQAIKLGKALFQYDEVARQYQNISNSRQLNDTELSDFYQVLQLTGFKDAGAAVLNRYINKHPKHKQAWVYLAQTEALTGYFQQAIETLAKTEQFFGQSTQLTLLQVEMLLKAERFNQAWQVLSNTVNSTASANNKFWQIYTQIAWLTGHELEASNGYYLLLKQGKLAPDIVNRLIQFSYKKQTKQQHLTLLIMAWNEFKHPEYLLDAIQLSQQQKKNKQTEKLISIADQQIELFKKNSRYWVIKASIASQQKHQIQAKQYLLQALALDSQSINTRLSLLWHLVDYGSDKDLRIFLQNSLQIAAEHPPLWEVIAAGYRRLGEPVTAIPWYRRSIQQQADDYLLLLNYAETLIEAGEIAKATKIQHFVISKIRPELVSKLSQQQEGSAEFKRRYGAAILEQFGIDISQKWFTFAEKQNHNQQQLEQAIFDEYRITWMLTKGRVQPARHHVLKALHNRVNLASWQQMAIAIYDNDLESINDILQSPRELLATDKVIGHRTVGLEQTALNIAKNNLKSTQSENELLILRRQAADLGVRNPQGLAITGQNRNISELDLWGLKSTAAISRGIDSFWLDYEHIELSSSRSNLLILKTQSEENNLSLKWRHRGLRNETWLQGYANLRADHDLYGIKAGNSYKLWEGWSVNMEVAYNELSEESSTFRLAGARDRMSLGLIAEATKRHSFSLNFHGRHFKTRSGYTLGTGYGLEFSTAYRVKYAQPRINLNLHGSLSAANLTSELPTEIKTAVTTNRGIKSVLAKEYKEIGLNLRIQDGEFRPFGFVERNFHYYLDSGVFLTDPSSGIGSSVEAGIGMRLFAHDDLSINARYAGVQGGVNSIATNAIELRYSFRFD